MAFRQGPGHLGGKKHRRPSVKQKHVFLMGAQPRMAPISLGRLSFVSAGGAQGFAYRLMLRGRQAWPERQALGSGRDVIMR